METGAGAVITGYDLCTVAGHSLEANVASLRAGAGCTSGPERGWNTLEYDYGNPSGVADLIRDCVLGALELAGWTRQDVVSLTASGSRVSLIFGSNFFETGQWEQGGRSGSLLWACNSAIHRLTAELAINGVSLNASTACSSGASAEVMACQLIEAGESELVIVCGYDVRTVIPENGMRVIGALSKDRIQPFALNRSGTELADGVGVLVLESREWAERRSAVVYASVAGYGIRSDAYNISAPDPEGAALEKAMRSAIAMSGIDPDQVGYINAHGSGTPLNDELETRIIRKVFGGHAGKLLINSSKSIIGHTLGAAGVIESVITVLALVHGRVHATANYTDADPDCDLNYCTNGYVDADLRFAMSNSIGFGGTNVCIVFEKGGACDEA